MNEQQQSKFVYKPGARIFSRTPYELYFLNFVIGVSTTLYFPTLCLRLTQKDNWSITSFMLPNVVSLLGLLLSTIIGKSWRHKIGMNWQLTFGVLLHSFSMGSFMFFDSFFKDKNTKILSVFVARGLQGLGSGIITSLSNHILDEDPVRECRRKNILQFSIVLGMILGAPISVMVDYDLLIYGITGGLSLLGMFLVMFAVEGNKLTKFATDKNMKISLSNVAFQRRGLVTILIFFIANLACPVLEYGIPIIDHHNKYQKGVVAFTYAAQGIGLFFPLFYRRVFHKTLGARLGIQFGLACMAVGFFLISSQQKATIKQFPLLSGLFLIGLGLGNINIFSANELLSTTSNFYRINLRYIRDKTLMLLYGTSLFSSLVSYLIVTFFFDLKFYTTFFFNFFIVLCFVFVFYLAVEGWRALAFPHWKKKVKQSILKDDKTDEISDGRTKAIEDSLIDGESFEIQKERYINSNVYIGKYSIGDTFTPSSPFIAY